MRPPDLVKAIHAITGALPDELVRIVLLPDDDEKKDTKFLGQRISQFVRCQVAVAAIPNAFEVFEAFGLTEILSSDFADTLLSRMVGDRSHSQSSGLPRLWQNWRAMLLSSTPLERLLIPGDVRGDTAPPNILRLDIPEHSDPLYCDQVVEIISAAQRLYIAICAALELPDSDDRLAVAYIATGTSFRIDIRGISDAIKQMKLLIESSWRLVRHRHAEELTAKNTAMLDSLETIQHIHSRVKRKSLKPEEGERLKQCVVRATLDLFKHGALPEGAGSHEVVDNYTLLVNVTQARHSLPPGDDNPKKPGVGADDGRSSDTEPRGKRSPTSRQNKRAGQSLGPGGPAMPNEP